MGFKLKILLIDDDILCLESLSEALIIAGHECAPFSQPREALTAFKNEHFDLVITDICMPEINGIDVLSEIILADRKTRVILMTGFGYVKEAISTISELSYALFKKPLKLEDVLSTVDKVEKELAKEVDY